MASSEIITPTWFLLIGRKPGLIKPELTPSLPQWLHNSIALLIYFRTTIVNFCLKITMVIYCRTVICIICRVDLLINLKIQLSVSSAAMFEECDVPRLVPQTSFLASYGISMWWHFMTFHFNFAFYNAWIINLFKIKTDDSKYSHHHNLLFLNVHFFGTKFCPYEVPPPIPEYCPFRLQTKHFHVILHPFSPSLTIPPLHLTFATSTFLLRYSECGPHGCWYITSRPSMLTTIYHGCPWLHLYK